MEGKRQVSIFIPYKRQDGVILIYLQRRDKDAKRLPDYFGFFGGGIEENENPEKGLIREIEEELGYTPVNHKYLGRYDFPGQEYNVYYLEVGDDFESKIKILEGQYGKWFNEETVAREPFLIENDKVILKDFFDKLR